MIPPSPAGYWRSPFHLVCAAVMATLGAGTILRLPGLGLEYGGSAFLLVYLLVLVGVAWPLLSTEWLIGRMLRQDFAGGLLRDIHQRRASRIWMLMAVLYLTVPLVLVSYYAVMAGWSLGFVPRALSGVLMQGNADNAAHAFRELAQDAERSLAWHTIFVVLVAVLVARGLFGGIEWASTWLLFVALLLVLFIAIAAARVDGISAGLAIWARADWSALGWRGIFEAMRQALFTAGLGLGVMVAYGGYLSERASIQKWAAVVLMAVTGLALLAGTVVYGVVMAAGLPTVGQIAILFDALVAFAIVEQARWLPAAIYALVVVLATVSAMALLEPLVQFVMARKRCTRVMAVALVAGTVWLLGIGTVMTFGSSGGAELFGRDIFGWLQLFSTSLGAPLAVLLLVIYVGRVWQRSEFDSALYGAFASTSPRRRMLAMRFALVYPARIVAVAVVLYSLGLIERVLGFWGVS